MHQHRVEISNYPVSSLTTHYHAKLFAHELGRKHSVADEEKLAGTLFDAQVDLTTGSQPLSSPSNPRFPRVLFWPMRSVSGRPSKRGCSYPKNRPREAVVSSSSALLTFVIIGRRNEKVSCIIKSFGSQTHGTVLLDVKWESICQDMLCNQYTMLETRVGFLGRIGTV